jgi:hypothetical protein
MTVLWVVAKRRLVEIDRHFRGAYCPALLQLCNATKLALYLKRGAF